jgi:hypothetical protein
VSIEFLPVALQIELQFKWDPTKAFSIAYQREESVCSFSRTTKSFIQGLRIDLAMLAALTSCNEEESRKGWMMLGRAYLAPFSSQKHHGSGLAPSAHFLQLFGHSLKQEDRDLVGCS